MDTQIQPKSAPPASIDISPDGLNALGFYATSYPGRPGTYFTAKVEVRLMPYLSKQIDHEVICDGSVASVDLTPEGGIHFVLADTGYSEQYSDAFSDEGLGLLNDVLSALEVRHHTMKQPVRASLVSLERVPPNFADAVLANCWTKVFFVNPGSMGGGLTQQEGAQ